MLKYNMRQYFKNQSGQFMTFIVETLGMQTANGRKANLTTIIVPDDEVDLLDDEYVFLRYADQKQTTPVFKLKETK
jgi:hypothetical protein